MSHIDFSLPTVTKLAKLLGVRRLWYMGEDEIGEGAGPGVHYRGKLGLFLFLLLKENKIIV